MRKSKGFTLIELLVVIAIIGILAAIVLVSLSTARQKAQDARVKASINQVRTLAEMVFSSAPDTYASLCTGAVLNETDPAGGVKDQLKALAKDINDNNGTAQLAPECVSSIDEFCVSAQLNDTSFICVGETGKVGTADCIPTAGANIDACD